MLERVWPKLIVEENNLQVHVSALRKILGADAIATVPGRGYRFTPLPQLIGQEASAVRAHNLPQPLTSFVGRENDLAEYAQMLEQTRLLTLTGIGGCGKMRLAIELARMVLPSFPDGVRFVDLAPVAEGERVVTAVATTLGVCEEVDKPLDETLARHLGAAAIARARQLRARAASLHQACRAFVDDRPRRARVAHEPALRVKRLVPVRSLASPPTGPDVDTTAIAMLEAVRLFVDGARHIASNFALNGSNAVAVAEICRRLDGIPLAIELAAARSKVLSVEQIRSKLDDRFRLLAANSPAMSRHQTLSATSQ